MKKTLIALLLALLLLLSLGCTGKGEPKETKPVSETAGQTETTPPETEDPGTEKKAFLLKIANDQTKSPSEIFGLLNGDYSLDNFSYTGVAEESQASVNAYKGGNFYSETPPSIAKYTILDKGWYVVVQADKNDPSTAQYVSHFSEGEVGESLTIIGSAGFTLASYFSKNENEDPELKIEQIVLDGDRAIFTQDYLDAYAKANEMKSVEMSFDFTTMTLEMIGKAENPGADDLTIKTTMKYAENGRPVSQIAVSEIETEAEGQKVSATVELTLSDVGFDEKNEPNAFKLTSSTVTKTTVQNGEVNYFFAKEQKETGVFSMKDGRPDADLSMEVTQTVSAAGQQQSSSYVVKEQLKPGIGDKYLLKIDTYTGDVLAASVSADCVLDGRLYPESIPEAVTGNVKNVAEFLASQSAA